MYFARYTTLMPPLSATLMTFSFTVRIRCTHNNSDCDRAIQSIYNINGFPDKAIKHHRFNCFCCFVKEAHQKIGSTSRSALSTAFRCRSWTSLSHIKLSTPCSMEETVIKYVQICGNQCTGARLRRRHVSLSRTFSRGASLRS